VAEPLRLVVWSPSETTLDLGGVAWVHVELVDSGGLTIWPGHIPLIGESMAASLRYQDAEGEHALSLPPGILHVREGTVTIFLGGEDEPTGEAEASGGRFERLAEAMIASLGREAAPGQRERGIG
jgi:F0F1-type ATP synthase epsilon subunit